MNTHAPSHRNILANSSMFGMLNERQLDDIVVNTTCLHLDRKTLIIDQGAAAEGSFWVVYGQVQIGVHNQQGGEKTVEILGQSTCFGLGEMWLGQPHLAFAKTSADSMLLHTKREAMLRAAHENVAFANVLMSCVGRQLYGLLRDIGSYAQKARQRLAGYLLRQRGHQGRDVIELVANRTLIASRLSLTPETLSRLLHDFSDEGMITIAGRRIDLIDCARLATLSS